MFGGYYPGGFYGGYSGFYSMEEAPAPPKAPPPFAGTQITLPRPVWREALPLGGVVLPANQDAVFSIDADSPDHDADAPVDAGSLLPLPLAVSDIGVSRTKPHVGVARPA